MPGDEKKQDMSPQIPKGDIRSQNQDHDYDIGLVNHLREFEKVARRDQYCGDEAYEINEGE